MGVGSDVSEQGKAPAAVRKRADARRNEQVLLDAAAAVFVTHGVNAPVRLIAAKARIGMGTVYRHFPTRADLIVAVYRHQVEALADAALLHPAPPHAAPHRLAGDVSAGDALATWMDRFVDFLVTKHGLAGALRSDESGFQALHAYFLDRLVPVCATLLARAVDSGEIGSDVDALALMHAAGNLCIGVEAGGTVGYDAHRMVGLLIAGLRHSRNA